MKIDQQPVLMIPLRRCGSHALRLRLNFCPEFYAPYPLHIVDFMPILGLYGDLQNDEAYFRLIIDLVGLQTASMVKWEGVVLEPEVIFESVVGRPRSIHTLLWEMLFQAGRAHGARVVMDKSLDSVHYVIELMEIFDNMRFINVIRDPRAQVSSMTSAIIHDFDVSLNAKTWVKAQEAGRCLARDYPDRVLTIRFEDFLNHQEATLTQICAFLDMQFKPEMLDIHQSHEAKKISSLSQLWVSNASNPIPANINKFKKTMSAEEIEIVETIAGDYMNYYGYERMTPGQANITEDVIARKKEQSEILKIKAWENLQRENMRDYQLRKFRSDYINMVKTRLECS